MFSLRNTRQSSSKWIIILTLYALTWIESILGATIFPSSGTWQCNLGQPLVNHTLLGGIRSGEFKKIGIVPGVRVCSQYCCDDSHCSVAFVANRNCYLVNCDNPSLCTPVPAKTTGLHPALMFVTRTQQQQSRGHQGAVGGEFGDVSEETNMPTNAFVNKLDRYKNAFGNRLANNKATQQDILRQKLNNMAAKWVKQNPAAPSHPKVDITGKKKNKISKAELFFKQQIPTKAPHRKQSGYVVETPSCYPSNVHKGVSLRWGTRSGEFYDYGDIGNMKICVDLCCKDKTCDVAFMVGKTCYTVACYSFDMCQMIAATKKTVVTSQLAYVIKRNDKFRKEKLKVSKGHEIPVDEAASVIQPRVAKKKINKIEIGSPKSEIGFLDDENVPKNLTLRCKHNHVYHNSKLAGGQKAGIYTYRGTTPNMMECTRLCCADLLCDAAFLIGKRCYSVQCYRNGKCAGKAATTYGLQSRLSFVERADDQDLGEKRTSIPGLLPTDRQYTAYINITNEEFKEGLKDQESLEFLNFAEALRSAITVLYGNIDGFKYVEILQFRPNKVIAVFNLTADQGTHPKVLLQILVDALRKGEIRTNEDPTSNRLTVDVRGFKFLTQNGDNLVCSPEFNYDSHWPLAVYGTSVNIPCPRDAKGLSNRKCVGQEDEGATWNHPDFSDCVSQKYEELLRETQLLSSSSIRSPELTTASIIDRLLQMTTTDTYGPNPPDDPTEKPASEKTGKSQSQLSPKHTVETGVHRTVLSGTYNNNNNNYNNYNILNGPKAKELEGKLKKLDISLSPFFRGRKQPVGPSAHPVIQQAKAEASHPNPRLDPTEVLRALQAAASQRNMASSQYVNQMDTSKGYWSTQHRSEELPRLEDQENILQPHQTLPRQMYVPPPALSQPWRPQEAEPAATSSPFSNVAAGRGREPIYITPSESAQKHSLDHMLAGERRPGTEAIFPPQQNLVAITPKRVPFYKSPAAEPLKANVNKKKYLVSIKKRKKRETDELELIQSVTDADEPGFNDVTALGFDPREISKEPMKRAALERGPSTVPNQAAIMDSLVGDDFTRVTGSATLVGTVPAKPTATPIPTPSKYHLLESISYSKTPQSEPPVLRKDDNKKEAKPNMFFHVHQHETNEATTHRPSKSVITRPSVKVIDRPVIIDVSGPNIKVIRPRLKPHRDPFLLSKASNDISYLTTTDGKDASSHTEGQLSQPHINAMADAIIQHGQQYTPLQQPPASVPPGVMISDETTISQPPVYGQPSYNPPLATQAAPLALYPIQAPPYSPLVPTVSAVVPTESAGNGLPPILTQPPLISMPPTTKAPPSTLPVVNKRPTLLHPNPEPYITDGDLSPKGTQDEPYYNHFGVATKINSGSIIKVPDTKIEDKEHEKDEHGKEANEHQIGDKDHQKEDKEGKKDDKEHQIGDKDHHNEDKEHQNEDKEHQKEDKEHQNEDKDHQNEDKEHQSEDKEHQIEDNKNQKEDKEHDKDIEIGEFPTKSVRPHENHGNKGNGKFEMRINYLHMNDSLENAHKFHQGSVKQSELIFVYEKSEGKPRASMFGGDILISLDIVEELSKFVAVRAASPSSQEIKEFISACSNILDEKNMDEWKHAQKHIQTLDNDHSEVSELQHDLRDWKTIHKIKGKKKEDVLMGFVNDIENYGKSASKLISRYNTQLQQPIVTKNIISQFKAFMTNDIDDSVSPDNVISFPNYTNNHIDAWSRLRDSISIPAYMLPEMIDPVSIVHMTFFRFKTVYKLQRFQKDKDEEEPSPILDESPLKLGTHLMSLAIEPNLGGKRKLPISIVFANTEKGQAKAMHKCSFWNFTSGEFSDYGCKLIGLNKTHARCQCSHTTTYGVLIDESSTQPAVISKPDDAVTDHPPTGEGSDKDNDNESARIGAGTVTADGGSDTGDESPEEKPVTTRPPKPSAPTEAKKRTKDDNNNNFLWILILLIILLLLLLLLLLCLLCCCFRRKKESSRRGSPDSADHVSVASPEDQLNSIMMGKVPKWKETGPSRDVQGGLGVVAWLALSIALKFKSAEPKALKGSSTSGDSVGDDMLIDKSGRKKKTSSGSSSTSRTSSPEPSQSPGWRKLMSNAHHPENLLLKEKALLFADYHQPYNFLSHDKEKPNTSLESIYGSPTPTRSMPPSGRAQHGVTSAADLSNLRRKRNRELKQKRLAKDESLRRGDDMTSNSDTTSDEVAPKKFDRTSKTGKRLPRTPEKAGMSAKGYTPTAPTKESREGGTPAGTPLSGAHSMEWDPYLESKQKEEGKRRKEKQNAEAKAKRNISPITEEPTTGDSDNMRTSIEPQVGSEREVSPTSTETIYPLSLEDLPRAQAAEAQQRTPQTTDSEGTSPIDKRASKKARGALLSDSSTSSRDADSKPSSGAPATTTSSSRTTTS